ncbi:hypothetical protein LQZ19_02360 [Treponema primitia]|uniref:hypothetical protein n=1 Tax=Treponema primitia TaxID=88058 RepID=UPI00397ECF31
MSVFEAVMLSCFAVSWPVNIYKAVKSRSAKGVSLPFLFIVWIGYCSGVIHKILFSRDLVMILYIANVLMVGIDIIIYFINAKRDRAAGGV